MSDCKPGNEQCTLCRWRADDLKPPCGRIFKGIMFISPKGGAINWEFTPGLVPNELEADLEKFMGRLTDFITKFVDGWPGWKQIAELQEQGCPGREEMQVPFLKVVSFACEPRKCSTCVYMSGCAINESYDPDWVCPKYEARQIAKTEPKIPSTWCSTVKVVQLVFRCVKKAVADPLPFTGSRTASLSAPATNAIKRPRITLPNMGM